MAFSPTTKQILHPSNKRETSRRDADKTRQQLRNYIHTFEKSPSHQSGVRQKERDDYVTRFLKLATLLSPSTMMSLSLSLLSLGYKTKPINSTWKTHRVRKQRPSSLVRVRRLFTWRDRLSWTRILNHQQLEAEDDLRCRCDVMFPRASSSLYLIFNISLSFHQEFSILLEDTSTSLLPELPAV